VKYDFGELDEVSLAYAVTIHKSQGSEFPAVVIPLATQQYMLLQRHLIYTGITRGKRLLVLIGQKKALGIAVRNDRPQRRYSGLLAHLEKGWVDRDGMSRMSQTVTSTRHPPIELSCPKLPIRLPSKLYPCSDWVRDFKVSEAPGGTPNNPRICHSAHNNAGR